MWFVYIMFALFAFILIGSVSGIVLSYKHHK